MEIGQHRNPSTISKLSLHKSLTLKNTHVFKQVDLLQIWPLSRCEGLKNRPKRKTP